MLKAKIQPLFAVNRVTMSLFSTRIRNQMTMLHRDVVLETPASEPGLRKWVQVIPPNPLREEPLHDQPFLLSIVELAQPSMPDDDWNPHPSDIRHDRTEMWNSIEHVETRLVELGYEPAAFVEPWNCDFPF